VAGDPAALEQLVPIVYQELRRLAHYHLRRERDGHTLQTTALVHEVYLRLCGQDEPRWEDRAHFFAVSARMMRRILVDYSRRRGAEKRGPGAIHLRLDDALSIPFRALEASMYWGCAPRIAARGSSSMKSRCKPPERKTSWMS
jgi:RNA polymerase sigma factor (TIGR02999 family)